MAHSPQTDGSGRHRDLRLRKRSASSCRRSRPPATLSGPSVKLSAEANWLVCERLCIPGSAKLEIELPVAGKNAPANEEIFSRYRRALPQSWPGDSVAKASWTRNGSELRLAVESSVLANYPVAEFFPLPDENVVVGHPQTERGPAGKITFRVPIETQDPKLSSLDGLVVFGQDATGLEPQRLVARPQVLPRPPQLCPRRPALRTCC